MAAYAFAFFASLFLNALITFRSSNRLWSKYSSYVPFLRYLCPSSPSDAVSVSSFSEKRGDGGDEEEGEASSESLLDPLAPEDGGDDDDDDDDDATPKRGNAVDDESASSSEKDRHSSLLRRYLIVYLLATLSDWLQGPYVYALYDAYGYSQHEIAVLFVAGFGSSMVFGSFVGGMADWCGRKKFVTLFAAIYGLSCVTKHFKNFQILLLGRLLGGVATSLLFSVFEAWLIRSHSDAKIDKYLSSSFSSASYGNSVVAIVAGLLANKAASSKDLVPFFSTTEGGAAEEETTMLYVGGYLNPFDIALVALCACGVLAGLLWEENYGDDRDRRDGSKTENDDDEGPGKSRRWYDGLRNAYVATVRSGDIFLCGLASSLFEGSMYVFVFMWTPALTKLSSSSSTAAEGGDDDEAATEEEEEGGGDDRPKLPFGLIFSTFMVCCMAGSSLFSVLVERTKIEVVLIGVFALSSVAMLVVATSTNDDLTFVAMNVFEACVGCYFPAMGTAKGSIVPEDKRAAIYNLYRIPLNFVVLFSLLTDLTPTQSFGACASMLAVATAVQWKLTARRLNVTSMADLREKGAAMQMTKTRKNESENLSRTAAATATATASAAGDEREGSLGENNDDRGA